MIAGNLGQFLRPRREFEHRPALRKESGSRPGTPTLALFIAPPSFRVNGIIGRPGRECERRSEAPMVGSIERSDHIEHLIRGALVLKLLLHGQFHLTHPSAGERTKENAL